MALTAAGCTAATVSGGGASAAHPSGTARQAAGTGPSAWHGPGLAPPAAVVPFGAPGIAGQGRWHPAARRVDGVPVIYEAQVVPPGGTRLAGLAWMDTRLLAARLYSGSVSPGGLSWKFTAPVRPAQAATLVAAFNGGFKMKDAHAGYYSEGRLPYPLARGAASLVIYSSGSVTVGAWGTDVGWSPPAPGVRVVAVRQNLVPLVAGGRPTAAAAGNWHAWGSTCGAHSCAHAVPGIEHQWRSGVGVTASGALVYALGPDLDPLQLAQLLVRAGVVRGMQLDINPDWPVFATYAPAAAGGPAAPANGRRLLATVQGPATFFDQQWARDFITMSAR